MSWRAKAFIAVVLAAGGTVLVRCLLLRGPWDLLRFFSYLVLATVASGLKVNRPGVTGSMSVLFIFLLAAVSELAG